MSAVCEHILTSPHRVRANRVRCGECRKEFDGDQARAARNETATCAKCGAGSSHVGIGAAVLAGWLIEDGEPETCPACVSERLKL